MSTPEMETEFWKLRHAVLSKNHEAVCQMALKRDEILRRIAPEYYDDFGVFDEKRGSV